MPPSSWRKLKTSLERFRDDQSGMMLIYVTIAIPVIVGFSLLAIDVGRLWSLQSSLQHGADALALAGAGELDRKSDSITRATNAINNLVSNPTTFATTVATINGSNVTTCFLSALPADDGTPIQSSDCLTNTSANAQSAHYVMVTVNAVRLDTIFPVTYYGGGSNNAYAAANATAGFDAAVCNFTPLFMCNPLEPAGNTDMNNDFGLRAMTNDFVGRRHMVRFLAFTGGNNVTAVPGQFGFLNISGGGANALGDAIASISPPQCYVYNTLQTKTGSMTSIRDAFNVRFDLYKGSYKATASYPPSINVRKGYDLTGNKCNGNSPGPAGNTAQAMGLPVDSCFFSTTAPCTSNPAPYNNANIGNGDWGYDPDAGATVAFRKSGSTNGYWDTNNFPVGSLPTCGGSTCTSANPPSRYDQYRYEITQGLLSSKSNPPVKETGNPVCAPQSGVSGVDTTTGSVDRRIIYGAVMNCAANNLRPGSNGVYHALAFGKFFMVRPINKTDNTLWTEIVDFVYPGDGTGVARDIVQLYR